jgi:hypothetical protein
MKRRSLKFEPGYMDLGRMSLELGHHGDSQNGLKVSCPFWREGCGGHHVWRRDIYLIPHLNGGIISRMGSWEEEICLLPARILKTGEKRKVEGAREGGQ